MRISDLEFRRVLFRSRLDALLAEGVTTVEVKSGYGLDTDSEIRMLRAARRLGEVRDVRVSTTFLGAHALPPDYEGDADAYIAHVVDAMLPEVARRGRADAGDAFRSEEHTSELQALMRRSSAVLC